MDLIYKRIDAFGNVEAGYLARFDADFQISCDPENYTNDFEIRMELPRSQEELLFVEGSVKCIVYAPGTEFGGEISGCKTNLEANEIAYTGRTWRGMQDQYVIEPPAGQDYLIVSGSVRNCLLRFPMNPIINIGAAGQNVSSYKVNRYVKTYEGVTGLLKTKGLVDSYAYDEINERVNMTVAPPRDLRNLIDISPDYGDHVRLKITRDGNTPRHLICLGQGELREREVIHLYAGPPNWTISQTPVSGAYPVETYDNTSTENLLQDGTNHYKELIGNHTQIAVDIFDLDIRLSDIISARDHLTGEYAEAEISRIVWTCRNRGTYQEEEYQYETKVRT